MAEDDPIVTARVPTEWLTRADALAERLSLDEAVRAYARPTRSMIVRLALLRGIEVLEKQHGVAATTKTPTKAAPRKAKKKAVKR